MHLIYDFLERYFFSGRFTADDTRRRVLIALFVIIVAPVLAVYGISDILRNEINEGVITILLSLILFVNLFLIRLLDDIKANFRLTNFLALFLLIYELVVGGGRGYSFVWFYVYPVLVMFVFGRREGLIWSVSTFVLSGSIFVFNLSSYKYSDSLDSRFIVTYMITIILAYIVESSRSYYYNTLLTEKKSLETALQEVKSLRELLPICSYCKKVRDDKGYWSRLEEYLQKHLETGFSHGICPECLEEHYSDIDM